MDPIVAYIIAHPAVFSAIGIAILDFIFAINPATQNSGILHAIYTFLMGFKKPPTP